NFSPESRDAAIAQLRTEWEKVLAPYRQLEGAGRVSRTGLLDVKAAYDILGAKVNSGSGGSSSSGGCVAGIPAVIVGLVLVLALRRMKSRP
ncbi:MAG: hypothetical protein II877_01420, partial [Synergistaceae bacterium]|nr:hypothetical protein [Synergistaceae bacterium]